jgi:nitrite reductase/ring-hydroxylating ferredoxin subunit
MAQDTLRKGIETIGLDSGSLDEEYKLKGLESIDLKSGEKREVEVEGIEGAKVLLVNVGGTTTALGAKCTHYGSLMDMTVRRSADSARCTSGQGCPNWRW